jgi:hypothetical protein
VRPTAGAEVVSIQLCSGGCMVSAPILSGLDRRIHTRARDVGFASSLDCNVECRPSYAVSSDAPSMDVCAVPVLTGRQAVR